MIHLPEAQPQPCTFQSFHTRRKKVVTREEFSMHLFFLETKAVLHIVQNAKRSMLAHF